MLEKTYLYFYLFNLQAVLITHISTLSLITTSMRKYECEIRVKEMRPLTARDRYSCMWPEDTRFHE